MEQTFFPLQKLLQLVNNVMQRVTGPERIILWAGLLVIATCYIFQFYLQITYIAFLTLLKYFHFLDCDVNVTKLLNPFSKWILCKQASWNYNYFCQWFRICNSINAFYCKGLVCRNLFLLSCFSFIFNVFQLWILKFECLTSACSYLLNSVAGKYSYQHFVKAQSGSVQP